MALKHEWSRPLPSGCEIYSVRIHGEWIDLSLYCSDYISQILINIINGRIQTKERKGLELKGVIERRGEFYVATCYRGYENKLWNKVLRGLNLRFLCRTEICVSALMKPNRDVEITIMDKDGETIDIMTITNVYDYDMKASSSLIVLTTKGYREESTSTLLIDPATASIIDHITGFGGNVLASLDHVFVSGFRENRIVTKVFSSDGEEVLEIDGQPVIPPYNPIAYQIPGSERFEAKNIVVMDRYEVKVFDTFDYSTIYTVLRPPFTRGVIDIDHEEYSIVTLSHIMGKPFILKYDFNGVVKWVSHIVRDLYYALVSNQLVAMYTRTPHGGETRVYRIEDGTLIHEDSFGYDVYPLVVRRNNVLLTNEKVVSSYTME